MLMVVEHPARPRLRSFNLLMRVQAARLRSQVSNDSWKTFAATVLGTWMAIWFQAALHNQYLIRIAPEHFTVWHYRMPFFTSHTMLGIAYACLAAISPGLLLGICLYIAGRLSEREPVAPWRLVLRTFWVWLAVEICSVSAGLQVWRSGRPIYPLSVYPEDTLGMFITQSIQITAYLSGALFSVVLLVLTWRGRKPLRLS